MSRIYQVTQARIRADDARRFAGWFSSHIATRQTFTAPDGQVIDALRWAKPGTSVYRVDYLSRGGSLIITGDLGDAVFEAYGPADGSSMLDWWGRHTDLHYLAGKCVASEVGRGFHSWDRETARRNMRRHLADDVIAGAREIRREFRDLGGWMALDDESEWREWLGVHGSAVLGQDHYEWSSAIGRVIHIRCRGIFHGLRQALAQLSERGAAA